jgi:hypothetical protein
MKYTWWGWTSEPETTGDGSGDPDKWFLTIVEDGEEKAVIVHRTCGGKFPLDGLVAKDKERAAQQIVDALNATVRLDPHTAGRADA